MCRRLSNSLLDSSCLSYIRYDSLQTVWRFSCYVGPEVAFITSKNSCVNSKLKLTTPPPLLPGISYNGHSTGCRSHHGEFPCRGLPGAGVFENLVNAQFRWKCSLANTTWTWVPVVLISNKELFCGGFVFPYNRFLCAWHFIILHILKLKPVL